MEVKRKEEKGTTQPDEQSQRKLDNEKPQVTVGETDPSGFDNSSYHSTTTMLSTTSLGSDQYHRRTKKPGGDVNSGAELHISNFPPDVGEEKLREMFSPFGKIVRLQLRASGRDDRYCLIRYEKMEESERALEKYRDYAFDDEWKLKVSIQERRTSSLSEEPTNLYVRNIPKHWNEESLRHLFQEFGDISQCRISNDGIAFVRLDHHLQSTNAIDALNGKTIDGCQLEVKFATRRTAADHYKTGQTFHKENKNNLYVRFLPRGLSQRDLEDLFRQFGKISCAKLNESGIAFVRYVTAEDAQRAIEGLHNQVINGSEPLIVKLAYYDIGDPRNRLCVHIGNLPEKITLREVEKLVFKYGKAATVKMNEGSGEAFARYVNADDAEEASKQISGLFIEGSSVPLSAKVIYYDGNALTHRQNNIRGRHPSANNHRNGRFQNQNQSHGHIHGQNQHHSHGQNQHHSHHHPHQRQHQHQHQHQRQHQHQHQHQHYQGEENENENENSLGTVMTSNSSPAPVIVPQTNYYSNNNINNINNNKSIPVNYSPTGYSSTGGTNGSPSINPLPTMSGTPPIFNPTNTAPFEWGYPAPMWNPLGIPLLNTSSVPLQFVNTNPTSTSNPTTTLNLNPTPTGSPNPNMINTVSKLTTSLQNPNLSIPTIHQQAVVTTATTTAKRQKVQTSTPSKRVYTLEQQKLGDQLYQRIKSKHPHYVAKLTGMILTMSEGDDNYIQNLLANSAELDSHCETLVQLLKSKQNIQTDLRNLNLQTTTLPSTTSTIPSTLQSTSIPSTFILPNNANINTSTSTSTGTGLMGMQTQTTNTSLDPNLLSTYSSTFGVIPFTSYPSLWSGNVSPKPAVFTDANYNTTTVNDVNPKS